MQKILTFLFLTAGHIFAQDIRSAYIYANWLPGLPYTYTYSITVTLFVDASQNIIRPTIPISFGDGNSGTFSLTTSSTENGIGIKTYSGTHTYAGSNPPPSSYNVIYLDTFRISGIKNMYNSATQPIGAVANIYANIVSYYNKPALISNFPGKLSIVGDQVVYEPNASDVDGDSLSYSLINCYPFSNYHLPVGAAISQTNGTISFSKDSIGLYAFCLKITEWKINTDGVYQVGGSSQMDFVMDITTTVGLNKPALKKTILNSYPNPVKDKLYLEALEGIAPIKATLKNSLGQTVFEALLVNEKNEIDCKYLPRGVYTLIIEGGRLQQVAKLIKE